MILFCCQDSGPSNYISNLILNISIEYICICSHISENYFKKNGIKVLKNDQGIDYTKIKLIVTGTCLGDGIDKYYVLKGKKKRIKTISIIEHWSLYNERFKLDGKYIYPNYIFVNDQLAYDEAVKDNVPKEKLIISGNPYLNYLSKKKLSPIETISWKKNNNLNSKTIITFISESFKDDFSVDNFQGFDEYQVLEIIMKLRENLKFQLLIRKHPSEPKEKYMDIINENIKIDQNSSFDSIICNSSYIIGMGSMFLIEASLFRKDIISLRPNEKINFIGNKLKLTNKITNKSELHHFIKNNTQSKVNDKTKGFYFEETDILLSKIYYS